MKKAIQIIILFFAFNSVFAQFAPGRYIIKLALNQRAIQANSYNIPLLEDACPDYNNNCQNQIWDIKAVNGQVGLYTIQSVLNMKYLTFKEAGTDNQLMEELTLMPIKPNNQLRFQSFYIAEVGDGKITIKPQRISDELNNNNLVFLSGDLQNLNSAGSMLKFEYKDERYNPRQFNNMTNVYFTLFVIPTVNITQASTVNIPLGNSVINSPQVVVAPKLDNKIDIDFKTGSDNLEVKSFQENLEIRLIVQSKPDVILTNANKNQNWPNNSVRRVTVPLPNDITANQIKEIHLYRKQKSNIKYVWELGEKDNWNLETISAVATIVTNGEKKKFEFEKMVSAEYGKPLYRFTYDSNNNETEGNLCKKILTLKSNTLPPAVNANVPAQNAKLEINIGTGGDDLRGGNDNCDVVLVLKGNLRKMYLLNVFNKRPLANFTEKSITKDIPNSRNLDVNDIKAVEIHHTGGGGMGADNWDVDKIKITLSVNGQTKILVDKVGTPIQRFDGDNRNKTFNVE
jgi:hypothetical protein